MAPSVVSKKDDGPSTSENFDLEKTAEEAKSLIEKVIKDVGKKSATRQLIFGSASGWYCITFVAIILIVHIIIRFKRVIQMLCVFFNLFCAIVSRVTGFVMMKLGKAAAFTVGSGILALQLANSSGYVKINWDKLTRGVEKVAEQVEDSTSDKKKGLLKKVTHTQYLYDEFNSSFNFSIILSKFHMARFMYFLYTNCLLGQRHCREQLHYGRWIYGWFLPWCRLLINRFPKQNI